MAKRKQNIVVQEIDTNPKAVYVFVDSGIVSDIESIEGVLDVTSAGHSCYAVHLDPRYDKQEIIAEIIALGKDSDVSDVWNGA